MLISNFSHLALNAFVVSEFSQCLKYLLRSEETHVLETSVSDGILIMLILDVSSPAYN